MIKRLLIGLAGTNAAAAKCHFAMELARSHGAEVQVMSIVDPDALGRVGPVPMGGEHFAETLRSRRFKEAHERAEADIARFQAAAAKSGVPFRVLREEGRPLERLMLASRYADLVVLGLRCWFDEHGAEHGAMAHPEQALRDLIHHRVYPILALGDSAPRPIHRVLIGYDGSMDAAKAMKGFCLRKLWPDAQVEILCCDDDAGRAERLLTEAADYVAGHGHKVSTSHRRGRFKDVMPVHVEEADCDMVVMGCSFRDIWVTRMFGRNTLHAVRHATRPLLLAH